MGRGRYHIYDSRYPHFITITSVKWLPLFSRKYIADICLSSLQFLQENDSLQIYGWVIMENHIHMIAKSSDLSKNIWKFKGFTARKIVDEVIKHNHNDLLQELKWGKVAHKHGQEHQVWQEGIHPEIITSREMMVIKLDYIHMNPVQRGWVDQGEEWRYSSMRDYCGKEGLLKVCTRW